MTRPLTGKTALVTGGSRNIGQRTALALAARGADVIVTYREQAAGAEKTVAGITAAGCRGAAIQADLTGCGDIGRLVEETRATLASWGGATLDILVNNAGTLRLGTFEAIREDDLDAIYATNYKSVFFLVQALAPHLTDGGRIVNLGSGTASTAFGPLVSYGPFKAALQCLTLYLASYFGPRGIAVNAVAPGGLDDDFNAELFRTMPAARDYIVQNTALGRIGGTEEIAEAIAFLCSPEAGFVSGAVLPIDGGFHL